MILEIYPMEKLRSKTSIFIDGDRNVISNNWFDNVGLALSS